MKDPVMWGILIGVTASAVVYGVCRGPPPPRGMPVFRNPTARACDPRKGCRSDTPLPS